MKTLRAAILGTWSRYTQSGTFVSTATIHEQGRGNAGRAVVFGDLAERFEVAMNEHIAKNSDGVRPDVEFTGFWKKREWNDAAGDKHAVWEFNVRDFALKGERLVTREEIEALVGA